MLSRSALTWGEHVQSAKAFISAQWPPSIQGRPISPLQKEDKSPFHWLQFMACAPLVPRNYLSTELCAGSMSARPASFLCASTLHLNPSTASSIIYISFRIYHLAHTAAAQGPRDDQPRTRVTVTDSCLMDYWHTMNLSAYFHQMKMYLLSCIISTSMPCTYAKLPSPLTCIVLMPLIDIINKWAK